MESTNIINQYLHYHQASAKMRMIKNWDIYAELKSDVKCRIANGNVKKSIKR